MIKNKKGNITDWFFIIPMIFVISVVFICCFFVVNALDDSGAFAFDTNAQESIDSGKNSLLTMDTMLLFIIIGLSIFVLVSSAVVFNHPVIFFIAFFLLFIAIILAAVLSNSFWYFSTNSEISAAANSFPKTVFIMNNFPLYILFMGVAGIIAMYTSYNRQ